ncbi:hypothetical protein KKH35_03070, partial [Patescibacteria group bacterium]|nr:hypothetical protein [Patescibacteria group bacterium]
MPKQINQTIIYFSIIIIAIASIFWVNGLILAWSPPSASPPSSNVSPPLNTGSSSQTKSGSLISNTDIRAPIFYDQDNTGYYLNPAGASILNDIRPSIMYDRN